MTSFDDVYELLAERYHHTPALNDALEYLVMHMLRSPSFPNPCESAAIFGPGTLSQGIEIEGRRADGSHVTAVFRDLFRMSQEDLEPLLSLPNRERYVMLYFVTTAEHGAAAVRSALDDRQPPVQVLDRAALNALPIDWYSLLRDEDRLVPPPALPPRGSGRRTIERVSTTAFVSYSWDSDEHKAWVRRLAERTRGDGVDARLDQWETAPGDQLTEFMERGVRDHDFVLIVCTPKYRHRSDSREGGVGYEGDVMTAEVMTDGNQRKFIPIWKEGQWKDAAPSWLAGKYRIDLSGDPYDEEQYADLIRTLRRERPKPPPVGSRQDGGVGPSAAETPRESSQGEPEVTPVSIVVRQDGRPHAGVDVLALFPNKTWKRETTDSAGEARLGLHSVHLPLAVFAAAQGYEACVEEGWIPAERTLTIELAELPGGGSAVFAEGTGYLPGLAGRLNPILDTSNRTYLYASNIAIGGGQQQPVSFAPGEEEVHLMDANGSEMLVRVVAITGRSSLLEYRPV